MKNPVIILAALFVAISCGGKKAKTVKTAGSDAPVVSFCADSAFSYIKKQTDFGPRVPNTDAQLHCAAWLTKKLADFGAQTTVQEFESVTFDNTKIRCYNIIGSINPDCSSRIILCSHWDSRPWADNDPTPQNARHPLTPPMTEPAEWA